MADAPKRRVVLGVCGGIAAFKASLLVRELVARGLEVRCVLTRSAEQFVTPLTLEILSGHEVHRQEYLEPGTAGVELHVELAQWADVYCVAPATAHTLARMASGLADDFLTTSLLMFDGPVVVAPAMHETMWRQETTRQNASVLKDRGVRFVGPVRGALASGELGEGRMSEPAEIAQEIASCFEQSLEGKRVLVTAGGTREAVDPVRFLGNRSSGKMGFAIAEQAARQGAHVTLVAGPVALETPPGVQRVDVVSAAEMKTAVEEGGRGVDGIVMSAAVADFRPKSPSGQKIKKTGSGLDQIELEPTADILGGLRDLFPEAVLVGFAAETQNLRASASSKLERKRLDLIVANDVSDPQIGFESDDNEVLVLSAAGEETSIPRASKREVARELVARLAQAIDERRGSARGANG